MTSALNLRRRPPCPAAHHGHEPHVQAGQQIEVLHGHLDEQLAFDRVDLELMRATVREAAPAVPVAVDLLHVGSAREVIVVIDYTTSAVPPATRCAVRAACRRIAASPDRYGLLDATVDTTGRQCHALSRCGITAGQGPRDE